MNKRSGWFDHDRDLVGVVVAEPVEGQRCSVYRMAEMPKAQGGGANQYVVWGSEDPPPTLASQGIDKNLAKQASR